MNAAPFFRVPLVDLGDHDPKYTGVLTPQQELGREKIGVSDFLLAGAEEYYRRFEHYGYAFSLLQRAIQRFPQPPSGVVLDVGSGFGNTVIPLLEVYPKVSIIASDISPDLLAILRREATSRGSAARCATVAFDLHGDYFHPGIVDAVFGGAVLHHLINPLAAMKNVLSALRAGGRAVFFEPFQAGFALHRIAYEQILAEARRRELDSPAFRFLNALSRDIYVRTHQRVLPDTGLRWEQLDDKWLFARGHFEKIAEALNVTSLHIEQIAGPDNMFVNHTRQSLIDYGGLAPETLPEWAWDILRRLDDDFLSPDLKRELILEGIVTFVK
jgi:SAM-dependent methyltransferase